MKLRMRPAGAFLLLAAISACDIPSGVPRWDTEWITPGEETTVSVAELLPAGIVVNDDTTAFVLTIDAVDETWTLSDFCDLCPPVSGTAPKPAFSGSVSTTAPIPAGVMSAETESGEILIQLTNGFSFDPLRPGVAADSGTLTITITSGTETVASLEVDGADQAFAPGSTLDLTLDFVPSTITGDLNIELTLVSPAGDEAALDPNDGLVAAISSPGIVVSEAVVALAGQPIEGDTSELDLEDVDVGERLKDATIFLDIENPFGVTGELTLTVTQQTGGPIVKGPFELSGAATQTIAADFDEADVEQMVDETNRIVLTGNVDGGAVTVRPDMVIGVTVRVRATVELGGDSDSDND